MPHSDVQSPSILDIFAKDLTCIWPDHKLIASRRLAANNQFILVFASLQSKHRERAQVFRGPHHIFVEFVERASLRLRSRLPGRPAGVDWHHVSPHSLTGSPYRACTLHWIFRVHALFHLRSLPRQARRNACSISLACCCRHGQVMIFLADHAATSVHMVSRGHTAAQVQLPEDFGPQSHDHCW